MAIDLNALRDRVHKIERERENDGTSPTEQSRPIVVDREGGIHLNSPLGEEISRVPIEKFALSRIERDRSTASRKLPRNTKEVRSSDYGPDHTAWLYKITSSFGTNFTLFANFDGSSYQVRVIEPEIEEEIRNVHAGHIYRDGRICFDRGQTAGCRHLRALMQSLFFGQRAFALFVRVARFRSILTNDFA